MNYYYELHPENMKSKHNYMKFEPKPKLTSNPNRISKTLTLKNQKLHKKFQAKTLKIKTNSTLKTS